MIGTLVYPYSVEFKRTKGWYDGRWAEISNWLNDTMGDIPDWEYMDEHFWFKKEEHKTLFLMRWT